MNNDSIVKQFDKYLKKNTVKDLICSSTKIVLICESPRTQELNKGLPLVGSAGESAFKHLLKSKRVGLGEYDFKKRLKALLKSNDITKIILCGNFAKRYFDEIKQELEPVMSESLTHPARNGWSKLTDGQECILEELRNAIRC